MGGKKTKTQIPWVCPAIMLRGNKCHIISGKTYICIDLSLLIENYKNYGFSQSIEWKCRRIIWIGYFKNSNNDA